MKKEITWLFIGIIIFTIGISLEIKNNNLEKKIINQNEVTQLKSNKKTKAQEKDGKIAENNNKEHQTNTKEEIKELGNINEETKTLEDNNEQYEIHTTQEENLNEEEFVNNINETDDIELQLEEIEENNILEPYIDEEINEVTSIDKNISETSKEEISEIYIDEKTTEETNTKEKDDKSKLETPKKDTKIKLNCISKYLEYKNSFQLIDELNTKKEKIIWQSSNPKIVSVDSNGKITATGGGIATITAKKNNEIATCKVIAIKNDFKKLNGTYRTTATIYYDGNKKITYYFRRQNYKYACTSEKVNGKELCTSGFKTWYSGHGCGTISTTAVVNAYLGKTKDKLISPVKMRMVYEKNEYKWKSKKANDPYCNTSGNLNQLTRTKIANVLNNQFNLSATPYTIKSTTGNEEHIERIKTALAEGRPVIIFVNAKQAGTTKFTKQNHTLTMVGFANNKGHVLVLDSSHDGFKEDTVEKMVNQYIGRGTGSYRGYIVLNKKKA